MSCRTNPPKRCLSNPGLKSSSPNRFSNSTPAKSPPKKEQALSELASYPQTAFRTDPSHRLEHCSDDHGVTDQNHRESNLSLWAHRLGLPESDVSHHGRIDGHGGLDLAILPVSDYLTSEVNGLVAGDKGTGTFLIGSLASCPSVAENQHQVYDSYEFSRNLHLLDETFYSRAIYLSVEDLHYSNISHQLGIWVYSTVNAEITLTERMEKYNWEGSCLQKL